MVTAFALAYVLIIIIGAVIYHKVSRECRLRAIRSKRPKSRIERSEKEWDMIERLKKFNTKDP